MAAMSGRVITAGKFFGEDMIMGGRRTADCRALTYLDVYQLEKEALDTILEEGDFNDTKKLVRKQVREQNLNFEVNSLLFFAGNISYKTPVAWLTIPPPLAQTHTLSLFQRNR